MNKTPLFIADLRSGTNIAVGTACTMSPHSDCYPGTVSKIVSAKCVEVQEDDWKIVKGSEHDGSAEYEYSPNTNNPRLRVRLTKRGWRTKCGLRVGFGARRRYYDPSF
jgi:hypothetical protein